MRRNFNVALSEKHVESEFRRTAHLSTGVDVFSMKLIIFSFTFTDLDLRANVILLTKDLTPLPSAELLSDSP